MKLLLNLIIGIICISFLSVNAQTIDTQIVYNFSEEEGFFHSEIKHVKCDDDFFLVAGNVMNSDSVHTVFIAAYNYNAEMLWRKFLPIPEGISQLKINTHENLKSFGANRYVIAGNADEIVADDIVSHPFAFVFQSNGDSVKYIQFENTLNIDLGAVNYDYNENILLGGIQKPHYISCTRTEWEGFPFQPIPWLGIIHSDLSTDTMTIPNSLPTRRLYAVNNIGQLTSDQFIIGGRQECSDFNVGGTINIYNKAAKSHAGNFYVFKKHNFGSQYDFDPWVRLNPNYDFSFQFSRYKKDKVIAGILVPNSTDGIGLAPGFAENLFLGSFTDAVYTANVLTPIDTIGPVLENNDGELKMDFALNGLLKVREAWNTDIIGVKHNGLDTDDSFTNEYTLDPLVGRSLFFRADNTGAIYYYTKITYFAVDSYTEAGQVLVDLDQREDSKKIVLVGHINSDKVLPGKWDNIGKTSWIVIMDDTTTTIPPSTTFIDDIQEGQLTFKLYPNPNNGLFYLQVPIEWLIANDLSYQIVSTEGKIVGEGRIDQEIASLNCNTYAKGNYFIIIKDRKSIKGTQLFVVKE